MSSNFSSDSPFDPWIIYAYSSISKYLMVFSQILFCCQFLVLKSCDQRIYSLSTHPSRFLFPWECGLCCRMIPWALGKKIHWHETFYKSQIDKWLNNVLRSSTSLLSPSVWSDYNRGILKSLMSMVHLLIFNFRATGFCFMYFEAVLVDGYKIRFVMSSWKEPLYHLVLFLFIFSKMPCFQVFYVWYKCCCTRELL